MKYLILAPGGLSFYTLLGYLMRNQEQLKEVEEISGASSGAMIGFFLLSSKSLQEIYLQNKQKKLPMMKSHTSVQLVIKFNLQIL